MIEDFGLQYQPIAKSRKIKCGCYIINHDLVKMKPEEFILAPLKMSDYHLEIANAITNVNLTQLYHNPTDKFLEMEYNFPIAPNACVYRFTAQFGNIRIEGVVKEKEEAKKQYQEAIKEGKKAAYGALNEESKDILTLKVGNVPPKESVKIQISYLQELSLSCNTFYQLHMTGTISPRYMNFIPGQVIKAGLRNQAAKAKGELYWNFRISLRTTRKVTFFDSHTHDIELVSQNDTCTESELVLGKQCLLNKDFVFSYTTEDFQLPSYVFGRTDAGSTAMLSFIPKFCDLSIDDAYKASVTGKGWETDIQNGKGEYIFLLDRSGSMGGARIQKAKQALILFIKSLPEDTYFNVISFGSRHESLFPKSRRYSDKEVNDAVNRVKTMGANLGGTQIYDPLYNLVSQKPIEGYPKQIFLLTDGCVSNTEGVIKMVSLNNKFSRVHTIGIGNGCSQQLIVGCAEKGKGQHVFINDNQDSSQKIIQLLTDSLSPVISKIKLNYDKELVESIIPNPQSLPYILKNEIVNFYVTFKGQLEKPAFFQFSYDENLNKLPYKSEIVIDPSIESESFVDRMGHFKRIRILEDSHKNNSNIEDMMYYVKKVDKKAEIINESVKHQILSEFTAFLCVQKELVDGKYEEVKEKGQTKVKIQNPLPIQKQKEEEMFYKKMDSRSMLRRGGANEVKKKRKAPKMQQMMLKKSVPSAKPMALSSLSIKPSTRSRARVKLDEQYGGLGGCEEDDPEEDEIEICDKKLSFEKKQETRQIKMWQEENQKGLFPSSKIKEKKKQKQQIQTISISDIVSRQSTQGCWKQLELIGLLYTKELQAQIANIKDFIAVVTYLVAKWIEKNHPQKQYKLVVKKGLNFVNKNVENFEKLSEQYKQFVQ